MTGDTCPDCGVILDSDQLSHPHTCGVPELLAALDREASPDELRVLRWLAAGELHVWRMIAGWLREAGQRPPVVVQLRQLLDKHDDEICELLEQHGLLNAALACPSRAGDEE